MVLLPIETQSRELDAKLLLACYLAKAGMPTVVGSRQVMHENIASLPGGIYLAKDFRRPSLRLFRILKDRGCPILAWDEEGVVFYNRELYHRRRIDAETLGHVEELFAWNDENRALLANAPGYNNAAIHVTGNPRTDLLLPKLRSIFDEDVKSLRERFGKFVLINTNFGRVNPAVVTGAQKNNPDRGIEDPELAEFVRESLEFKKKIFERFQSLVPELSRAFPDVRIIIRPHVAENYDTWRDAANAHDNVYVLHEGNVYPWLIASEAVIQNGCTTGVEAFLLDRPVISYRPIVSDPHELRLPNILSEPAHDPEKLKAKLADILNGSRSAGRCQTQQAEARRVYPNLVGELAAQRMARHIAAFAGRGTVPRAVPWTTSARSSVAGRMRKMEKQLLSLIPGHKHGGQHSRQRFPGVSLDYMNKRRDQFDMLTGELAGVAIKPLRDNLFVVST